MKNIFQKIFKQIFLHLFFLVLGICLVIGATTVYAAWNDAKTGGSGQLSETNWNALVDQLNTTMTAVSAGVDNQYSAAYVTPFAWYTADEYGGAGCGPSSCIGGFTDLGGVSCTGPAVSYSGTIVQLRCTCRVCALAR